MVLYVGDILKDLIRRREQPPSILPVKLGKIDKERGAAIAMSSAAVSSKGVKSTEGEAIESCFRRATRL